jgi:hypothetical protein
MISPRDLHARKDRGRGCAARDHAGAAPKLLGAAIALVAQKDRADGREGGAAMAYLYLVAILALVAIVVIFVSIAVRRSERREAEEPTHWEDIDRRLW